MTEIDPNRYANAQRTNDWTHVCDTTTLDGAEIERIEYLMRAVGDLTAQLSYNGRFWVGTVHDTQNHVDITPEVSHGDMFHIMHILNVVLERPENQP